MILRSRRLNTPWHHRGGGLARFTHYQQKAVSTLYPLTITMSRCDAMMTRCCCFWENTCMWGNLRLNPSISQKIIRKEVINTSSSWRTLRSLVWLTSPSTLIWSYLHSSERWQAVAWGFVFCFRGRSQAWACICARQNHHTAVIYHHVSAWASAALFAVTQLIFSVNHGGVQVKCGFVLGADIHTKAARSIVRLKAAALFLGTCHTHSWILLP